MQWKWSSLSGTYQRLWLSVNNAGEMGSFPKPSLLIEPSDFNPPTPIIFWHPRMISHGQNISKTHLCAAVVVTWHLLKVVALCEQLRWDGGCLANPYLICILSICAKFIFTRQNLIKTHLFYLALTEGRGSPWTMQVRWASLPTPEWTFSALFYPTLTLI